MKKIVDGTTWNDYLAGAMRALRLDDLDLAENRLDKAFAAAGNDVACLHLAAGRIALFRGALPEAEKSWRRALEIDADNAEAWNNLGVLYRRQGKNEKALDALREAEERAPDRPDIPYNIGNLLKAEQRYDEAIGAYNRSIEINPGYAPAYNNLGTLYESRREREKAQEVFRRGLSADKRNASLWFNVGLIHQEQDRWDEAKEAFDSALKSRPGWTPGLNNLGIVLQEMGREDEAARTFRALLDIEPDNVSALNNLGVAYDRLGRNDDARRCFRKALDEEPNYIKAALNLHDSYHESRELNEALEELNKQIGHHPVNPDIRIRMARTLMSLTRWEEAEQSLDHVLERNPHHLDALRTKADLFLATSRPQEAEAILSRLPHDPDIIRDLARLNISSERSESAERLLNELIAVDPDDAESRRLMADLISRNRPKEALRLRKEAVAAAPGNAEDLISLAELYGCIGDKKQALGSLDEAVNLLGSRGNAEDLDTIDAVLGLYENAAAALEDEHGNLFFERTAQLGRKLQSAMGISGVTPRQRGQIASDEIPLEEDDALSLLDINAMEPVIRINEEEETVYLEESVEDLSDIYTELYDPENTGVDGEGPGGSSTPAPRFDAGEDGSGKQPVHIHLPPQPAPPSSPQVIFQDVHPMAASAPEVSVEDLAEDTLPAFSQEETESCTEENPFEIVMEEEPEPIEETQPKESLMLEVTEEELGIDMEDGENDDHSFLVPDSDALSEDLPETTRPDSAPLLEMRFPEDNAETTESRENIDDGNKGEEFDLRELSESETLPDIEREEDTEEEEFPENLEPEKMAGMFKYLSKLADDATGDGRRKLIDEGVPLKLAGLYARLSGEPKFRDVAQRYDRRRRERHNVELDRDKIQGSFDVFKSLAESLPANAVRESLSNKLGKLLSVVSQIQNRQKDSVDEDQEDG